MCIEISLSQLYLSSISNISSSMLMLNRYISEITILQIPKRLRKQFELPNAQVIRGILRESIVQGEIVRVIEILNCRVFE